MKLSFVAAATAALFLGQGLAIDISISAEINGSRVDPSELKVVHHPPSLRPFRQHSSHHNGTSRPNGRRRDGRQMDKRTNDVYTANWCGVSQRAIGSDSNPVQNATAYFQIPSATLRSGQSTPQSVYTWVGIDGNSVGNALLQAGVYVTVDSSGTQTAKAFLQWYPSALVTIDNLPASVGDFYYVSINMTDNQNALVYIKDNNQGTYGLNITVSNGPALLRRDASWILEDASDASGNALPFSHFSTTWFEYVKAQLVSGASYDVSTADRIYMDAPSSVGGSWCAPVDYDSANFYVQDTGSS